MPTKLDWNSPNRTGSRLRKKKVTTLKGADLSNNSAPKLSPEDAAELKDARLQHRRQRKADYVRKSRAAKKAQDKITELSERLRELNARVKDAQTAESQISDIAASMQMLHDMRFAYNKANGRKKLADLVKNDDKQFASMVKELIRLEVALQAKNIGTRLGDGDGTQNFFVIVKGLNTEEEVSKATGGLQVGKVSESPTPKNDIASVDTLNFAAEVQEEVKSSLEEPAPDQPIEPPNEKEEGE